MKRYTIFETGYIPTYKEYLENCKYIGITPCEDNSKGYWEHIAEWENDKYEDLKINMCFSPQCQLPVLITGKLGLWFGDVKTAPVRCETLFDAINKCWKGADKIKVEYEDGVVYVAASHHDGTNYYEIHRLSKKGIVVTDKWENPTSKTDKYKGYWLAKYHGSLF